MMMNNTSNMFGDKVLGGKSREQLQREYENEQYNQQLEFEQQQRLMSEDGINRMLNPVNFEQKIFNGDKFDNLINTKLQPLDGIIGYSNKVDMLTGKHDKFSNDMLNTNISNNNMHSMNMHSMNMQGMFSGTNMFNQPKFKKGNINKYINGDKKMKGGINEMIKTSNPKKFDVNKNGMFGMNKHSMNKHSMNIPSMNIPSMNIPKMDMFNSKDMFNTKINKPNMDINKLITTNLGLKTYGLKTSGLKTGTKPDKFNMPSMTMPSMTMPSMTMPSMTMPKLDTKSKNMLGLTGQGRDTYSTSVFSMNLPGLQIPSMSLGVSDSNTAIPKRDKKSRNMIIKGLDIPMLTKTDDYNMTTKLDSLIGFKEIDMNKLNPFSSTINKKVKHGNYNNVPMIDVFSKNEQTKTKDFENAFYEQGGFNNQTNDDNTQYGTEYNDQFDNMSDINFGTTYYEQPQSGQPQYEQPQSGQPQSGQSQRGMYIEEMSNLIQEKEMLSNEITNLRRNVINSSDKNVTIKMKENARQLVKNYNDRITAIDKTLTELRKLQSGQDDRDRETQSKLKLGDRQFLLGKDKLELEKDISGRKLDLAEKDFLSKQELGVLQTKQQFDLSGRKLDLAEKDFLSKHELGVLQSLQQFDLSGRKLDLASQQQSDKLSIEKAKLKQAEQKGDILAMETKLRAGKNLIDGLLGGSGQKTDFGSFVGVGKATETPISITGSYGGSGTGIMQAVGGQNIPFGYKVSESVGDQTLSRPFSQTVMDSVSLKPRSDSYDDMTIQQAVQQQAVQQQAVQQQAVQPQYQQQIQPVEMQPQPQMVQQAVQPQYRQPMQPIVMQPQMVSPQYVPEDIDWNNLTPQQAATIDPDYARYMAETEDKKTYRRGPYKTR